MDNGLVCPHCDMDIDDVHNGGDPGPWWNGEDSEFETDCEYCDKRFIVKSSWVPIFETITIEDNG